MKRIHVFKNAVPDLIHIPYKKGVVMLREDYKGMVIKTASASGGKAGKGKNKTSTVQVFDAESCMVKQIRYTVGDRDLLLAAVKKAKDWIDGKPPERKRTRRPGAGPKRSLEGGRALPVYIDDPTESVMLEIGEGNLSGGIRLAAIVIALLSDREKKAKLEEARGFQVKRTEEIRETQKRSRTYASE